VAFVWSSRQRLARLFLSRPTERPASGFGQVLSQIWVFMVTAWLVTLWVSWAYAVLTNDVVRRQATELSWWITLLFPVGDRLIHTLLRKVTTLEFLRDTSFAPRRERFVAVVQTCARVILGIVALAALAMTWNLGGADLLHTRGGERVIGTLVDIGVTMLAAYVLYEVVMSVLDKHMPQQTEHPPGEIDGDMGGTGLSRQETLAPLLRVVFLVVLSMIVVLTLLSSLGVQVLPLLAGAGIVGIAIGFGSQKLVADVLSGVFFLIDDAFRRGEYIDLGTVKGTVEKISVRSMQLRHHMGALHTIPFGEIRHLTNYSRDWVMMKLKLRLTYDTDPEKVRKLVKKLGQELLEQEDLGEKFLQPLKSQGVYSMEDDSAMIIRVKFMTRPGDQFEVRKAVYAKIRELFAREGIEFAHRVVSVRLDGEGAGDLTGEEKKRVAGAALAPPPPAET
ncbi:MAG: mechanosensitive ion channel family protein, partial [Chloroflexi bacterium]|nr:mechanosensitive ion channel family protein [Chloroflexota bacterium]